MTDFINAKKFNIPYNNTYNNTYKTNTFFNMKSTMYKLEMKYYIDEKINNKMSELEVKLKEDIAIINKKIDNIKKDIKTNNNNNINKIMDGLKKEITDELQTFITNHIKKIDYNDINEDMLNDF